MNLSQIEAFLILSECLSVTETAEQLFCTQPGVSIKIRKLEDSLKTVLFERINNRLYLTPQGKVFQQYAAQIINLIKISQEHIKQFDSPLHGEVYFGASNFVGAYLLPSIMAKYKRESPNVKLSMDISTSRQLIQKLENHELEFLIISDHIHLDPEKYHSQTFLVDPLILICAANHPLAQRKSCQFSDIVNETFLTKPARSATRTFLFESLDRANKQLNNTMEISSLEAIKQGVIHELGISIVSKLAVIQELQAGILSQVNLTDIAFSRGIQYVYHKDKYLSPATQRFLSLLTTYHETLVSDI